MPPSPSEATNVPPNGQVPMPPSPAAPANTSDAKQIAEAQAQLLAKAIIEAQNMAVTPPEQFKEGSQQASLDAPGSEGASMFIDTDKAPQVTEQQRAQTTSSDHGERVIQPIHDIVMEQKREDMQKRMSELLGDTDAEPTQINTNTAKHVNDANVRMTVQNATQASEQIPMPVAVPQMGAQPQPAPQQIPQPQQYQQTVPAGYAQNIYAQGYQQESFINPAQTVMAQMQAAQVQAPQMYYLQQQQAQQQTMQSMDPRAAAIQLQQLQAEEARRTQYDQVAAAQIAQQQAQQLAQQQAISQQQALAQQQAARAQAAALAPAAPHKNLRVNDVVVKKAAQATILQTQKGQAQQPQQQPQEEPVQVIQPAYITQLETELAGDMQQKGKMSAMQRAMMAELADDEITLEASKIDVKPDPAKLAPKREVDNTPKEVLAAMQSAASPNIATNPNIASSTPTEINADIKHDK